MIKKISLAGMCMVINGILAAAEKTPVMVTEIDVIRPVVSPEMIRYAISNDRREVFRAAMAEVLTDDATAGAFWKVYDAYDKEKAATADARLNNVAEYVKNQYSLSDEKIKELLASGYKTQAKELKIRHKYASRLAKEVNPTVAGRFWQVDDFMVSALKVALLANVEPVGGRGLK